MVKPIPVFLVVVRPINLQPLSNFIDITLFEIQPGFRKNGRFSKIDLIIFPRVTISTIGNKTTDYSLSNYHEWVPTTFLNSAYIHCQRQAQMSPPQFFSNSVAVGERTKGDERINA